MERTVKISALCFLKWTALRDLSVWEAARRLQIAPRTLVGWQREWREHAMTPAPRGRPTGLTPVALRDQVRETLENMGPDTGIPVLKALFPGVPRQELEEMLLHYRIDYRRAHTETIEELLWEEPGTVWAMDYTQPPSPVDRTYRDIFAVRDLASGMQLAALPVTGQSAEATADALNSLFREHGAPLVIKSDNGSPLKAQDVQVVLRQSDVMLLPSPPQCPRFNGACEAGIGSLKTRTHHLAARNGRPGQWTCDDVEGARLMANETARPKGLHGPTPDEVWAARRPILADERDVFRSTVERFIAEAHTRREASKAHRGIEYPQAEQIEIEKRDALVRSAIRRALVAHGYLSTRRRRIPLPITPQKTANIS